MNEPYWWYILFVRVGAEHRVVNDMRRFFEHAEIPYEIDPFCPESECYYRSKELRMLGKSYVKRPLFPGYVFLETNMPASEFIGKAGRYIYASSDIIRLLKYGESDEIAMPENERKRFEFLLRGKRCIERSVGYIEGDSIHIEGGALVGCEGLITKIDRHNRNATIVLDMFGRRVETRVPLEIVRKS